MHFWKIETLKKELREAKVTEQSYLLYYLLPSLFLLLAFEWASRTEPGNLSFWDDFYSVSSLVIVLVGTLYCFMSNGGNKGRDFLNRFISIGFVMLVRLTVWMLILGAALFFFYLSWAGESGDLSSTLVDTIPFVMLEIWYFWRISCHLQDVKDI